MKAQTLISRFLTLLLILHCPCTTLPGSGTGSDFDQYKFKQNDIPDDLRAPDFRAEAHGKNLPGKEELNGFLKRFLGTWIGDIELSTMDGMSIRKFEVEQQYWWDEIKDSLEGLSVFEIDGEIQYAQSTHYIENHSIFTRVKEGEDYKTYKGKIKEDSIVWYPMDKRIALDHQLTESFVSTDKGPAIKKDGFERLLYRGIDTMLILKGELYKSD